MTFFPRKLSPDEEISRETVNRLIDEIAEMRRQSRTRESGEGAPAGGVSPQVNVASPLGLRKQAGSAVISNHPAEYDELVELVTDLHLGGSATAKVLTYDGVAWVEAETEELTVHDAIGTFEGIIGARALVKFHRRSGRWIVWQLRC
ncbi:MAG: hypothetical protein MPJ50_01905 [Pirellulales bacterium]|nr:hypothetical protein [Pirellulales bacterium]